MKTCYIILILLIIASSCSARHLYQTDSIHKTKSNLLKVNLVPLFNMARGLNQSYFSLEYENKKQQYSFGLSLDFGQLEYYKFIKFNNYFTNKPTQAETNVKTLGFHLQPYLRFYPLKESKKILKGIYISALINTNYYSRHKAYRANLTQTETITTKNYFQVGTGLNLGYQYKLYKNIGIEANASLFYNFLNNDFSSVSLTSYWHNKPYHLWSNYCVSIFYQF